MRVVGGEALADLFCPRPQHSRATALLRVKFRRARPAPPPRGRRPARCRGKSFDGLVLCGRSLDARPCSSARETMIKSKRSHQTRFLPAELQWRSVAQSTRSSVPKRCSRLCVARVCQRAMLIGGGEARRFYLARLPDDGRSSSSERRLRLLPYCMIARLPSWGSGIGRYELAGLPKIAKSMRFNLEWRLSQVGAFIKYQVD